MSHSPQNLLGYYRIFESLSNPIFGNGMCFARWSKIGKVICREEVVEMDIIAGLVVTSSSFLFAAALTGLLVWRGAKEHTSPSADDTIRAGGGTILATLVVVYFVATTQLLLIAQQHGMALGNFIVGLVVFAILYIEPAIRGRGQSHEENSNWRK